MRKLLIIGSLLAATAVPAVALADVRCVNPQNNGTTGAVVGAVGGAVAGSMLAGRHSRGEGAILGALGGAVLGDVIGNTQKRCPEGYYAYDDQRRQYVDNEGRPFTPPGYQGAQYAPQPAPAYGPPGQAPGYGAGPDQRDGYRRDDSRDQQGGYNRDQQGGYSRDQQGGDHRDGGGFWAGSSGGIHERIDFLGQRIHQAADSGRINHRTARAAYADLSDIRRQESRLRDRDGGDLNPPDRAYLQDRLDRAARNLHWSGQNGY